MMRLGRELLESRMDEKSPTSLYFLPCQAADPKQSFLTYYDRPERSALDPLPWITNNIIPLQSGPTNWSDSITEDTPVDRTVAPRAITDWRQKTPPHHGNERFFLLAVNLRKAGMDADQIKETLEAEAKFGRSPMERRAQIRSIMNSLKHGYPRK
jgi:hypothetical protein